jgi:toxin ParE1/3/4
MTAFSISSICWRTTPGSRERPEFTPPVRIHPYGAHFVVYTLDDAGILIARVLPGRAEWECWLA